MVFLTRESIIKSVFIFLSSFVICWFSISYAAEGDSSSYSGSQATNFTLKDSSENINPSTGALTLTLPIIQRPGYLNLSLNINSAETTKSMLGLPKGWIYDLAYIDDHKSITFNGTTYLIDPKWCDNTGYCSGLKYVNNHGLSLQRYTTALKLPTAYHSDGYGYYYNYKLTFVDGSHYYFDGSGKLIATDNRFGSHIIYKYIDQDASVFSTRLSEITDSFGSKIDFGYTDNSLTVSYTSATAQEHKKVIYFTPEGIVKYVDELGLKTTFSYINKNQQDLVNAITYPNGMSSTILYQNLPYLDDKGQTQYKNAVLTLKHYDQVSKTALASKYYVGFKGQNYTGYPKYKLIGSTDNLLDSSNTKYQYMITTTHGEDASNARKVEIIYNWMSLPVEQYIYLDHSAGDKAIYKIEYQYHIELQNNYKKVNYNKPYELDKYVYDKQESQYKLIEKTTVDYDLFGNSVTQSHYHYQPIDDELVLTQKINRSYDSQVFNQLLSTTTQIWNPLTQKYDSYLTNNELSPDGKSIDKTIAFNKNSTTQKRRLNQFTYSPEGWLLSSQLSWADDSHQGIKDTKVSYQYAVDPDTLMLEVTKTNAIGNTSYNTFDITTGKVITKTTAMGNKTEFEYDILGRLVKKTLPEGNVFQIQHFDYQADNINSVLTTSPLKIKNQNYYNASHKLIKKMANINPSNSDKMVEINHYDYDLFGQLAQKTDRFSNKSSYSYDQLGALISKIDPDKNLSTISHNYANFNKDVKLNNVLISTITHDANSKILEKHIYPNSYNPNKVDYSLIHRSVYDGNEHLVQASLLQIAEGDQKDNASEISHKTLLYDDEYQLQDLQVVKGQDKVDIKYHYDLLGKLLSKEKKLNDGTWLSRLKFTYNQAGQLIDETNNLDGKFAYAYNKDGQISKVTYLDGTTFSYLYNKNGKRIHKSWVNKNENHIQSHNYDQDGKLTNISLDGKQQSFAYNTAANLISVTYPDNKQNKYQYNSLGQLTQNNDVNGLVTNYSYDPTGKISRINNDKDSVSYSYSSADKPNENKQYGRLINMAYKELYSVNHIEDALGQLINIKQISTDNIAILNISNDYDVDGNIIKQNAMSDLYPNDNNINYQKSYKYDGFNRLVGEKTRSNESVATIDYSYDDNNNVVKKTVNQDNFVYTYNNIDQLTSYQKNNEPEIKPDYDNNGSQINDGNGRKYQYNALYQLINTTDTSSGSQISYEYYPDGLMAERLADSGANHYYYHGDTINAINVDDDNYTSFLITAKRMAVYQQSDDVNKNLYYMGNSKSNLLTLQTWDKGLRLVGSTLYSPYGEESGTLGTDVGTNFSYNGEYQDPSTHLVYLRARNYNPEQMRFMTMDSQNVWNKYNFADGNPIMKIDPSGHMPAWVTALVNIVGTVGIVVTDGLLGGVMGSIDAILANAGAELSGGAKLAGAALNYAKNEGILATEGAIIDGKKGTLQYSGFADYGRGAVENLVSTGVWAKINLSQKFNTVAYVNPLRTIWNRKSPFVLESTSAWATTKLIDTGYNAAEHKKPSWQSSDSVDAVFSIFSGALWDGVTESVARRPNIEGSPLLHAIIQSFTHDVWGGLLNIVPAAIQKNVDATSINAAVQNSSVFGAYFSMNPGAH